MNHHGDNSAESAQNGAAVRWSLKEIKERERWSLMDRKQDLHRYRYRSRQYCVCLMCDIGPGQQ